jgi:glycerol uptake facilitator protein
MDQRLFGEFMGTMVLVLLGNGVVANTLLSKSKAEGAGWVAVTAAWGFGVMSGIFTAQACGSPDAHLNPAVTLAAAVTSGDFSKLLPYTAAQIAGAMAGATLVWLYFLAHWRETPEADAKLGCFATIPAIRMLPSNFLCEAIGTFVLVLVGSAFGAKVISASGPAPGFAPYLWGSLVWGIGLSLGGTTGYAINPARDLGPRIMHTLLPVSKKRDSDWGYAAVPFFGPLAGAALAGLFIRLVHF